MTHNPQAALQSAITTLKNQGESKVYFLKFEIQNGGIGCQYHPGKATHELMGQKLADAVKSVLGI